MNDTIQYNHNVEDGITTAVRVSFSKEDLLETVHNFDKPIQLRVGKSFLHPKDRYNHKIGRELSSQRLVTLEFTLYDIVQKEGLAYITFRQKDDPSKCIRFRVNKLADKPHFIYST